MNFIIEKIEGLQGEFSNLVSMMNYARYTTMQAVEGLTIEELDYLYDKDANSIGMLLYHMAAIEFYYQIHTFEDREPTEAELEHWLPAIELGNLGRENKRKIYKILHQYITRSTFQNDCNISIIT